MSADDLRVIARAALDHADCIRSNACSGECCRDARDRAEELRAKAGAILATLA